MTTNTYQALYDSVGLSPITGKCQVAYQACGYYESRDYESCEGCSLFDQDYRSYPPQSAEQRERLLLLIIGNHNGELTTKNDFFLLTTSLNTVVIGFKKDCEVKENYHDALYALTHKLVQEGVLSKEEVKEALSGK